MGLRLSNSSRQAEANAYAAARLSQPFDRDHTQFKRLFDIVVAGTALLFVAPLIVIVAIAIRLQDGGRAFYSQRRYGLDGETFNCFKLRSMVPNAQEQLDHILVSTGLQARLRSAGIEAHLLDETSHSSGSGRPTGYPRSDHAPVWAIFEMSGDADGAW